MVGSLCYWHLPKGIRNKLNDMSEPMILLEYHAAHAYKLYNQLKHIIIVSRDMIVWE